MVVVAVVVIRFSFAFDSAGRSEAAEVTSESSLGAG